MLNYAMRQNDVMEDKTEKRRGCCRTLWRAIKYEWNWRHLGFGGAHYELFPFAQWMWMDTYVYPIYRFHLAVGLLVWVCVEIPLEIERSRREHIINYYFLYATNWSFLMYTLSSIVFAIFCTVYNCKKRANVQKWLAEILWFFYGMSMNTILVTSLVYWSAFWDPTYREFYRPESKLKHILPACTVAFDAWINGLPIRIFHAFYPMVFGIIYTVFSYLYYDAGNIHPIYPVLDWSKPLNAASACLLTITFGLVMQFVLFMFYVGRVTLSAHLGGRGVCVVEDWWKASSKVSPVKEDFTEKQVVEESDASREEEVDVEQGNIASNSDKDEVMAKGEKDKE